MSSLFVYDPNEVIVTVGGSDIQGFAPDQFISIVQNADSFATVVGNSGDVVRSRTSNRTATVEITLLQSSPSNDILSTIANLDDKTPNGAGIFALEVRNSATGRAVHLAANCWIKKSPDVTYGASDTNRTWVLECARLERFDGGA